MDKVQKPSNSEFYTPSSDPLETVHKLIKYMHLFLGPVTVAERSKAWTVFARSEAGIVGSNLTQGMDVWCVYAFILCLGCLVFR
jgi:hypothetical protein